LSKGASVAEDQQLGCDNYDDDDDDDDVW